MPECVAKQESASNHSVGLREINPIRIEERADKQQLALALPICPIAHFD